MNINDSNEEKELTFIFPYNYSNMSKFMGRFAWSGVCLAVGWIVLIVGIIFLLPFGAWAKFYIFLVLAPLPAFLLFVGINGDPTISFIKYIIKFKQTAKLYLFRKG